MNFEENISFIIIGLILFISVFTFIKGLCQIPNKSLSLNNEEFDNKFRIQLNSINVKDGNKEDKVINGLFIALVISCFLNFTFMIFSCTKKLNEAEKNMVKQDRYLYSIEEFETIRTNLNITNSNYRIIYLEIKPEIKE